MAEIPGVLTQLAEYLDKAMQAELSVQTHVASATLINSIHSVVNETVNGFEIVGSAVYYAKYVERGRRAGAKGVPLQALVDWIRMKRINLEGRSERSVAYLMQRSIKQKGIAPSLFISGTLDRSADKIDRDIRSTLIGLVQIRVEKIFNEIA